MPADRRPRPFAGTTTGGRNSDTERHLTRGESLPQSTTHLVLIPSFNTGRLLGPTVQGARAHWGPVWVVIDGSTDGSERAVRDATLHDPGLRVLLRSENGGKGCAVRHGLEVAQQAGYSHALVMDADGQHPAELIDEFMATSREHPQAMILGVPIFGADAPAVRVHGRKVSNWWTRVETSGKVHDSLFGFRIYPIAPLLAVMQRSSGMRGYDFDVEAAVRLCWSGVEPINLPAPVAYPVPSEGGISHFRYGSDNLALTAMHARLMASFIRRRLARLGAKADR